MAGEVDGVAVAEVPGRDRALRAEQRDEAVRRLPLVELFRLLVPGLLPVDGVGERLGAVVLGALHDHLVDPHHVAVAGGEQRRADVPTSTFCQVFGTWNVGSSAPAASGHAARASKQVKWRIGSSSAGTRNGSTLPDSRGGRGNGSVTSHPAGGSGHRSPPGCRPAAACSCSRPTPLRTLPPRSARARTAPALPRTRPVPRGSGRLRGTVRRGPRDRVPRERVRGAGRGRSRGTVARSPPRRRTPGPRAGSSSARRA